MLLALYMRLKMGRGVLPAIILVLVLAMISCTSDPCSTDSVRSLAMGQMTTELKPCLDSLRSNDELRSVYYEALVETQSTDLLKFAEENQIDPWVTIYNDQPMLSYMRKNTLDCLAYEIEILQFKAWNVQQERYTVENLILALHQGNVPVVENCLRSGFPARRSIGTDVFPITLATMQGNYNVVQLLLKYDADPNRHYKGEPVLSMASRNGYSETAKILIDAGAEIDQTDESGKTALMLASRNGKKVVVKLLLSYGADSGKADNDGKTAVDYAKQSGHPDVVQLLEKES